MKFVGFLDYQCPSDKIYVNLDTIIYAKIVHCINDKYRLLFCTDDDTFTYGYYDTCSEAEEVFSNLVLDDSRINYGVIGKG